MQDRKLLSFLTRLWVCLLNMGVFDAADLDFSKHLVLHGILI